MVTESLDKWRLQRITYYILLYIIHYYFTSVEKLLKCIITLDEWFVISIDYLSPHTSMK